VSVRRGRYLLENASSPGRSDSGLGRPIRAAVLLGLGLGGFFDGIVLHQVLQWHHMLTSAGYPPTSLENLQVNTRWDGLFHVITWVATTVGLWLLWSSARQPHVRWPAGLLLGGMLLGWGAFNTAEGLVDHHLLGLHHVNETAPPAQWAYWDLAFLAWGAAMLVAGWLMVRSARESVAAQAASAPAGAYDPAARTHHAA
jgi:uncharacterized membrane protein